MNKDPGGRCQHRISGKLCSANNRYDSSTTGYIYGVGDCTKEYQQAAEDKIRIVGLKFHFADIRNSNPKVRKRQRHNLDLRDLLLEEKSIDQHRKAGI